MDNKVFENAEVVDLFDCLTPDERQRATTKAKVAVAFFRKRKEMKMSQGEFAKYLNVSQSTISKWESGDYNFTLDNLAQPFAKLNLSLKVVPTDNPIEQIPTVSNYFTSVKTQFITPPTRKQSISKRWIASIFPNNEQYVYATTIST